jgi:hypothetical protein
VTEPSKHTRSGVTFAPLAGQESSEKLKRILPSSHCEISFTVILFQKDEDIDYNEKF